MDNLIFKGKRRKSLAQEGYEIRIVKVEERARDSWLDMGLRQLREGQVRFYRVNDPATGEWLFKACSDEEMRRIMIKALKCPPGRSLSQLEGSTMLFQESLTKDCYYDIISLSYIDEEGRLRRRILENMEEVPEAIREEFKIVPYEEATGKKAVGKGLVTLSGREDESAMITLFILERAWPISTIPPNLGMKAPDLLRLIKELEWAEINEVYRMAGERYGLTKEDADALLGSLEAEGKTLRRNGYIKTRR